MAGTSIRTRRGFTLVELLVVVGIIALLISILLPSLGKARAAAVATKCLANEHSIGQAMLMYSNDNKGVIIPSIVWGPGNTNDCWAFLLVAGKYLPDPRLSGSASGGASTGTVLVCPAIRDSVIYDALSGSPATRAGSDGFDRRKSTVVLPAPTDGSKPPEPTTNGANGAAIIDIGYGINGPVRYDGEPAGVDSMPLQPMYSQAGLTSPTLGQLHKATQFKRSAETVLLFDGTEWDPFNAAGGDAAHLWRVSGARHGNVQRGTSNQAYKSGTCNVLFLDGHAAPVNRNDLPVLAADAVQMYGDATYKRTANISWNAKQ